MDETMHKGRIAVGDAILDISPATPLPTLPRSQSAYRVGLDITFKVRLGHFRAGCITVCTSAIIIRHMLTCVCVEFLQFCITKRCCRVFTSNSAEFDCA